MKYDKIGILAFFAIVLAWALILTLTSRFIIYPENILVNRDVDLTVPTLIPVGFNIMSISTFVFINAAYLLNDNKIKKRHLKIIGSKGILYNSIKAELVSIVIPARNEEEVIRDAVLKSLQQTYNNIEVIVVCHNCTDKTFENAQVRDNKVKVIDLKTKEAGKAIALNHGIMQAKGKYILVLDADHELSSDFIEIALPAFDTGSYIAVQGRIRPNNRNYNFITRMLTIEDDLWSEPILTVRSVLGNRCPLLGTGFIIKKDILIEVGMFSNSLVDDHELTCRLLRKKFRILYLPFCVGSGELAPTLEIMLRQRARWGKGFLNLLNKKAAEPTDILGNIFWFFPFATASGLVMLLLTAYADIYNVLFGYLPFAFAYLPLQLWLLTIGLTLSMDIMVLIKQYGTTGIKYIPYLIPYIMFSQYSLVVFMKAFFVKSWSSTKTKHGFVRAESSQISVIKESITNAER
jgi:cellulose synthase/poly-beta-1,6-N-acetylglucosamine synthase-like glycosyltransferase